MKSIFLVVINPHLFRARKKKKTILCACRTAPLASRAHEVKPPLLTSLKSAYAAKERTIDEISSVWWHDWRSVRLAQRP